MRDESSSDMFAPFPPAKFDANRVQAEACDRRVAYTREIESGLRSNLLTTLRLIIERDPSIPACACRVPEDLALHAEHLTW